MAMYQYSHQVPLKQGVGRYLDYLKSRGILMGIATSNSRELVTAVTKALGIADYFGAVTVGCQVARGKPAPDVYLYTAKTLGVRPKGLSGVRGRARRDHGGKAGGHDGMGRGRRVLQSPWRRKREGFPIISSIPTMSSAGGIGRTGFFLSAERIWKTRGWEQPDFVYVTGDAYVDHPSFGPAIISRVLEAAGYKVAMLPQPDWTDEDSVRVFGRPRLAFLISGGNMDSMVNHYSVSKHRGSRIPTPPAVLWESGPTGR